MTSPRQGAAMIRRTLPQRRSAETFNLAFRSQPVTVTAGFYPDGSLGEIFIDIGKSGADLAHIAHDAAVVASLALQHGVPLDVIRHALMRDAQGRASGPLGVALDVLAATNSFLPGGRP
jgi:ribonucleoside-diphosphate reductase alpha chain